MGMVIWRGSRYLLSFHPSVLPLVLGADSGEESVNESESDLSLPSTTGGPILLATTPWRCSKVQDLHIEISHLHERRHAIMATQIRFAADLNHILDILSYLVPPSHPSAATPASTPPITPHHPPTDLEPSPSDTTEHWFYFYFNLYFHY